MHELFKPVERIVATLEDAGATCFLVGGAVRDYLLGVPSKDLDIEVHGKDPEWVLAYIMDLGVRVDEVGKAFGVLKVTHNGETFDFSFPRTERKTTGGHTGFDVTVDPFLGIEKALSRRDFTINAIAMRTDGSLVDPFGGIKDLIAKRLRHVGPAFSEDPLRILRGVQFAARFGFFVDPETAQLCHELSPELDSISIERVWGEFEKIGLKGKSLAHAVQAILDCKLGQRFGPVSFEFKREPDLTGLEGDRRVAVALASILVDPVLIGAPKAVERAMRELSEALRFRGTIQDSRFLARRMKDITLRDVIRIRGEFDRSHRPIGFDPRVLDGPIPLFIDGFDVTERGITGRRVGEILRECARLQDMGAISDRVDALDWLDGETAD